MQTHKVFLHDIIVDECRHELAFRSPNPIQSINQTRGNKPLQKLYSMYMNTNISWATL